MPIAFQCVREVVRRGNPVIVRVELQSRDEIQFLSFRFASRHLTDKTNHFCLTPSFFLSRNIDPVLEEVILFPVGAFTKDAPPGSARSIRARNSGV
jgi:hypothetical protein